MSIALTVTDEANRKYTQSQQSGYSFHAKINES